MAEYRRNKITSRRILALLVLAISSLTIAFPRNVVISIGNRHNTRAGLVDSGTNISGLTIKIARWWTVSSAGTNSTEILDPIVSDNTITIQIGHVNSTSNSTSEHSRRKRGILSIPTPTIPAVSKVFQPPAIPSIPIPIINGSHVSINGNSIPLPDSISNIPGSQGFELPWQFLERVVTKQLLPIGTLDPLVKLLATQYNALAKPTIDATLNILDEIETYASNVTTSGLSTIDSVVYEGTRSVIQTYNSLTNGGKSCVGVFPEDAGLRVSKKATDCVRDRWNELVAIVDQFRNLVGETSDSFSGWLNKLAACNASAFANESPQDQETAQRRCYVQATAEVSIKMLIGYPLRWSQLTIRIVRAVNEFEPQVAICGAGVGVEVASITAEYSVKLGLCQMIP
ncbi:uncharacterized protein LOC128744210 [Sabethes cyaneus]|uniref:uncharacterized protein LOC128744210 n=1 Tax=Sabethes cyaneus TaxID=53552 RepID=UPI00237ECDD9|nr:uncharacterized protein LOC128744210 [Sabethes cyaneus]